MPPLRQALVSTDIVSLLAWFPASWASKVAPCFIGEAGGATQLPQEVTIQCPTREAANAQRDDSDQVLQALKFTDKKVPAREAPTPSPKIISISGTKNEPKTNPLYLLVLVMTIFPFCSVDERGRVFPKPAIEALRGSARPGRGHASDAKRIGTRT